ncbi:hypothetical protein [Salinispora arenicola]|uniref:hypothetical protein n=1 Tax=Salinispora arenicola TaxID=168697 RepID=UPI00036D94CD|nr:hypothetical protein [Salinispora arenicola]
MRNAVFLVKNGIGFGHIRRALILAEAVQKAGRLRPVVISQASSLVLYRNSPVRVVNLPLLHRVPSAVTEDFYTDLLDRLLDRLNPAVVIEDTYPDARYRRLPALADRPRILVMRRLDGLSLDQIRQRGDLAHYDRILIAQDEADFRREGHSGETLAAVESSNRFAFVGNIACAPRRSQATAVRREYSPHGAPLVVVNGGAGGDQMPDGYGHRLFHACHRIAAALSAEANPAVFVFVTGPYYAGGEIRPAPNVTVRRFEPRLPALLAAADVAVIKPGNNALSEALTGHARLVLVPDRSFMEGLDEHAARVAVYYGGAVGQPDQTSLEPLIREALARPPRQNRVEPRTEAVEAVVRELHQQTDGDRTIRVRRKQLLLVLLLPAAVDPDDHPTGKFPPELRDAVVVRERRHGRSVSAPAIGRGDPAGTPYAILIGKDPPDESPQALADLGVRALVQTSSSAAVDRWLHGQPVQPALLVLPAERITARPAFPDGVVRRIARQLHDRANAIAVLDLAGLTSNSMKEYLDHLGQWVARQPIELVGVPEIMEKLTDRWVARG